MGLNTEERRQLSTILYNYTEVTYIQRQDRREFLDYLIRRYAALGLDSLDSTDRVAFLELVEEAL